jgi:hypothetical protein
VVGLIYHWLFRRLTYYRIDTMLMFRSAVEGAVSDAVNARFAKNGLRALTEEERKPIMREFLRR